MVVKSGNTPAGSRAAFSHTGALATSEIASEALFQQAGMIRLNTLEEVFGVATLLSHQPVPMGRRVAIITNGGGPGILAADACEQHGLVLPQFPDAIRKSLRSVIERDIGIQNPLDLTGGATAPEFEAVLKTLALDKDNDAVIVIFVPPVIVSPEAMEDAIRRVAPIFQRNRKPIVACFMGRRGFKPELGAAEKMVPSFTFPEDAVVSLAKAAQYGEWRRKPKGKIPKIRGIRRAKAGRIIETAMTLSSQRPLWLSAREISDLLTCYRLRLCETVTSKSAEDATALSSKMGFPVAVKLASSSIVHKTDIGGVRLDLKWEIEVVEAFN